jgi:hypothetical protein
LFNQKNALIFAATRIREPELHETRNVQGSDIPRKRDDAATMVAGYQKKIIFIK